MNPFARKRETVPLHPPADTQTKPGAPAAPHDLAGRADTPRKGPPGSGAVLGPDSYPANPDLSGLRQHLRDTRAAEADGHAEMASGLDDIRNDLGPQTGLAISVVQSYLRQQPASVIESLETTKVGDRLAGNDPDTFFEYLEKAIGPLPEEPQKIAEEIAQLEGQMRDRKTWFARPDLQLKYQLLVRARGR